MENEKKKSKVLIIIIVLLILIILGVLGWYFLNKGTGQSNSSKQSGNKVTVKETKVSENTETTKVETSSGEEVTVEANNKEISVNVNKIDLKSIFSEEDLVSYSINKYYVIDDIVVVDITTYDNKSIVITDINGNLVKKISGSNHETYYANNASGQRINSINVDGKTITFESSSVGQGTNTVCDIHYDNVLFKERIEYLGNKKFSSISLVDSTSKEKYITDNNIDCSSSNYMKVTNDEKTLTYNSITVKTSGRTAININGVDTYFSTELEMESVEVIDNYVLVKFNNRGSYSYALYDKNGVKVKDVDSTNVNQEDYSVIGNTIYFYGYNMGQAGITSICQKQGSDVVYTLESLSITSDGVSDIKVEKSISKDNYIANNKIDCSSNN